MSYVVNCNFKVNYQKRMNVLKLICLIKQPGIVTPSALERTMQVAYNAKLNSGCISRQVGAVVTDEFYSVKGIGWNEVPEGQTPCGLREIKDYESGVIGTSNIYTAFEKKGRYKDGSFIEKMKLSINNVPSTYDNQENGRNCPYCFKTSITFCKCTSASGRIFHLSKSKYILLILNSLAKSVPLSTGICFLFKKISFLKIFSFSLFVISFTSAGSYSSFIPLM